MDDAVFVPDLSCPPPGWGGRSGRGGGGHPTRVIRRGGGGAGTRQPQTRPANRASWGEEWRPQETEEVIPAKEDSSGGEDGEWKEVKGRRWAKEDTRKAPASTKPARPAPARKKTPEPYQGRSSNKRRSPGQRRSPDTKPSPDSQRRGGRGGPPRRSPELQPAAAGRRGSSSGSEPAASPPPAPTPVLATATDPAPVMLAVSDLPDEVAVRVGRGGSGSPTLQAREQQLRPQKEMLAWLEAAWLEVERELREAANQWPARVTYYQYYTNERLV